jgi:hypothetical protein
VDTYIAKALDELKKKSLTEIQVETALVWCGRACAAAELGLQVDAVEYAHEAIEHAALSGDDGVLNYVRYLLTQFRVPV